MHHKLGRSSRFACPVEIGRRADHYPAGLADSMVSTFSLTSVIVSSGGVSAANNGRQATGKFALASKSGSACSSPNTRLQNADSTQYGPQRSVRDFRAVECVQRAFVLPSLFSSLPALARRSIWERQAATGVQSSSLPWNSRIGAAATAIRL